MFRYLHEERLELQVWVTFHTQDKDKKRPAHRDKLIGSAYLMLHSLADPSRRQHRIRYVPVYCVNVRDFTIHTFRIDIFILETA